MDPTLLIIKDGLTGVVGPNGCGKSNLLEALRWVMGETSYKTMRASAMDDVIFSGTQNRPARNFSEVTIYLDNSDRSAPPAYNDEEELEITRRIERESGSNYRINSREVRAKDVQRLFADVSTGARSPSLVRQGQIGQLINAKPQERRIILEEAAGITGLHNRRHEAELRLRAAENNLQRLTDLQGQIEAQLKSLKRQARQALRYKQISGDIEKTEALVFHLKWLLISDQINSDESALREALVEVSEHTNSESAARRTEVECADALPSLRQLEASRAAALQRLKLANENLEREEEEIKNRTRELKELLEQIAQDKTHEQNTIREADVIDRRLQEEYGTLADARDAHTKTLTERRQHLEELLEELSISETKTTELTQAVAESKARRGQLDRLIGQQDDHVVEMNMQVSDVKRELQSIARELEQQGDLEPLKADIEKHQQNIREHQELLRLAEARSVEERSNQRQSVDALSDARQIATEIETEVQTLESLLGIESDGHAPLLVNEVEIEPGFETAVALAFGDDLDVSLDSTASIFWREPGQIALTQPLPQGIQPLANHVKGPDVLAPRLSQIGVVADIEGLNRQRELQPGQKLVSVEGGLWRWDGFVNTAAGVSPAAKRLTERRRLKELKSRRADARKLRHAAEDRVRQAEESLKATEAKEQEVKIALAATQEKLSSLQTELAEAEHMRSEVVAKVESHRLNMERLKNNIQEAQNQKSEAQEERAGLQNLDAMENELQESVSSLKEKRAVAGETQSKFAALEIEQERNSERIKAIEEEKSAWAERRRKADAQIERLNDREEKTQNQLEELEKAPEKIAERRAHILEEIVSAESSRNDAAETLDLAEKKLKEINKSVREIQGHLTAAKERRAALEVKLENSRERRNELVQEISEVLNCSPEACLKISQAESEPETSELGKIEAKLFQLKKSREQLGGVNLRAEKEAETIAQQFEEMEAEVEDLNSAIQKLKKGIETLNREGRKRLLSAFDEVQEHFKSLFKTLFTGGEAELRLIEADDPLEAGLEIFVRPPGKKFQVLTLLSGGEKALTALSLIFAVFLTNPAPICVLDEVDAPLDDANVERFCQLLESIVDNTDTRFLIITHHPLTMSRMNRLFGVTMSEKGVSQLVSVDLAEAQEFQQTG